MAPNLGLAARRYPHCRAKLENTDGRQRDHAKGTKNTSRERLKWD
jgi:hypothetical protein